MRTICKALLKKAFFNIAPESATKVMSARARAHSQRLVKEWGLSDINNKLVREIGNRVISGPFKGMVLTPMTYQEHVGPFLLGTYEMELSDYWDRIFSASFAQIIDVGAKFGYYAVGLARHFPKTPIIAFDTDYWARRALKQMMAANRVTGISIKSFCSPAWLKENLLHNALVISDCEGYEHELFCSTSVPALSSATMIIESHDCSSPGVSAAIATKFRPTHFVHQVSSRSDSPLPEICLQTLSEPVVRRASNEVRSQQTWLFLVPRAL